MRPVSSLLDRIRPHPVRGVLGMVLASILGAVPGGAQEFVVEVDFTVVGRPVVEGLDKPVGVSAIPDGRLLVLERPGRIRLVDPATGTLAPESVLDIAHRVTSTNWEQGLLGLCVHPRFEENGAVFVNYVDDGGDTRISRFTVTGGADALEIAEASEVVLLRVEQPGEIHNGGALAFGPHDGYLYVGLGDGQLGDPGRNAQDRGSLLGKLLRLDVDRDDGDRAYAIPPDNPHARDWNPGTRPEVFATGLRNPWRIAFDPVRELLFVGDVGQAEREELDAVPLARLRGANFGWRCREGSRPFKPAECSGQTSFVDPVFEYTHVTGCAIVGGVVVANPELPRLDGRYVFTDFCSGEVFVFWSAGGDWRLARAGSLGRAISSFGTGAGGEVYATRYQTGQLLELHTVGPTR